VSLSESSKKRSAEEELSPSGAKKSKQEGPMDSGSAVERLTKMFMAQQAGMQAELDELKRKANASLARPAITATHAHVPTEPAPAEPTVQAPTTALGERKIQPKKRLQETLPRPGVPAPTVSEPTPNAETTPLVSDQNFVGVAKKGKHYFIEKPGDPVPVKEEVPAGAKFATILDHVVENTTIAMNFSGSAAWTVRSRKSGWLQGTILTRKVSTKKKTPVVLFDIRFVDNETMYAVDLLNPPQTWVREGNHFNFQELLPFSQFAKGVPSRAR
jgi:hypothetical protein